MAGHLQADDALALLTNDEQAIAEAFTSVLDYVSRVAQAAESGDAFYGRDKAGQLANAALTLAGIFDRVLEHGHRVRGESVRAALEVLALDYRAGRALYGQDTGRPVVRA